MLHSQQQSQGRREDDVEVIAASSQPAVAPQSSGPESIPPVADLQTAKETQAASAEQAAVTGGDKPVANFEVFVEQLAHGMAYDPDLSEDKVKFLEVNGYRPGANFRGKRELVMRTFVPIQSGKPPIVAFRGTVPAKVDTLIADLDPGSIGMYQFKANIQEIQSIMGRAASAGPLVATGHSLGGALAQIAAATFSDLVGSIITFQAPGVSNALVSQLHEYNEANPDKAITSSHHRVEGDLVPLGGQALTEGTVHNHAMPGMNPLAKHLAYPLAQEERAAGNALPYQGDNTEMHHTTDISTEVVNADKTQMVEWARKGLGVLVYTGMEVGTAVVETGKTIIGFMTKTGRFIGRLFGGGEQDQEQQQDNQSTGN